MINHFLLIKRLGLHHLHHPSEVTSTMTSPRKCLIRLQPKTPRPRPRALVAVDQAPLPVSEYVRTARSKTLMEGVTVKFVDCLYDLPSFFFFSPYISIGIIARI
jgi:hypothetical protein